MAGAYWTGSKNLLWTLVFLVFLPAPVTGELNVNAYRPQIQERLNVRVVELGREIAATETWAAISGEYVIESSGFVSIPVAGRIEAAGRLLEDIEDAVADAIQLHAGLAAPPSVSIEVMEYIPIYVLGYVHAPGSYPYQPGMTVIQALALAGGERRIADQLGLHQFQELFRNTALERQVKLQLVRLRARAIRLETEVAGAELSFSGVDLAGGSEFEESLMREEHRLFAVRKEARARDEAAYVDLKSLLESEIKGLDEKLESHRRQIQLVRKTAVSVESLANRGLAPAQRLLDIQRMLAEVEGKLIDLETSKFRARQDLSKAARELADQQSQGAIEDERELQATRADMEQLEEQQRMLRHLIVSTGTEAATIGMEQMPDLRFSIMRRGDKRAGAISADEATELSAGDVISVRQVLPDALQMGAGSTTAPGPK